MTCVDGVYDPI